MPISFSDIPANWKVPLYWVEIDPSMAGLPTLGLPALLVGVSTMGTGGAAMDVPIIVGSQAQADAQFGMGSQLSRMFKSFFRNNFANQVYGLPVAPGTGAAAATASIVITTPPTEPGTISLYIGGEPVQCNVSPTDTAQMIAANLAEDINDIIDIAVIADGTTTPGTVKVTCNWAGISGNDITLALNYYGTVGGEITPLGLVMTMPPMLTGGSGLPSFTNAVANLGEQNFEYVALPLTDAVTLSTWETEYSFEDTGRWGWQRQLYGLLFAAHRDTYSNLITFGMTRNSGVTSIMAVEMASLTPTFEWAAAYCAKAQRSLSNDPARPLQTLSLNGVKLAPLHQRFNIPEINTLAESGLATQKAGSDNQPMISRESTTYQLNLYGNPDTAYELVTTLATLAKLIRNQKQAITSKFPRSKLANDGTRFGPGQAIVTPSIIKGELIAEYESDMYNGLVEDVSDFEQNLVVERDPNDPNRVNVLYPPDLINQLRVFAVLAQFRLQYNANIDPIIGANIGVTGIIPAGGIPA
jgi:phage tail sheath gpL-like